MDCGCTGPPSSVAGVASAAGAALTSTGEIISTPLVGAGASGVKIAEALGG